MSAVASSPTRGRGPASRERGAVLVLFLFLLGAILALAALAVDVAHATVIKRSNQSAADLAILAAGAHLGDPGGRDPRAACRSAESYLRANLSNLPDEASLPCDELPEVCNSATTQPVDITGTKTGRYRLELRYPVRDEDIPGRDFIKGAQDGLACERMSLRIGQDVRFILAPIMGYGATATEATAVVRGTIGFTTKINPALLLLKRTGCGALQTSGHGRIHVRAFDAHHPGVIAADTLGNTSGTNACTTNTNPSGYVVYGTPTPAGLPSIVADDSDEHAARLYLYATMAESTRDAYLVPDGVRPGPTAGQIVSRFPVDLAYNPAERPAIDELRTHAIAQLGRSPDSLRADGYTIFPDDVAGAQCQGNSDVVVLAPKVYVNCDNLRPGSQARYLFTGSEILVKGRITVGSGNKVLFPNAESVIVGGSTSSDAISVQGTFAVNDGVSDLAADPTACSTRSRDHGVDGAVLVVRFGPVTSSTSGRVHLCQTFVYLARIASPDQVISGGNCTLDLPCPTTNNGRGYLRLFGTIDWTAPNQTSTPPDEDDPFEDLALWTESSDYTEIKGQGTTLTAGVFFLPNAPIRFTGQGSQDIALNAQFISLSLEMSGQGTLTLLPNPADSVAIPFADYYLIR